MVVLAPPSGIVSRRNSARKERYHIEKEDKRFFPASMGYFSQAEQDAMLEEMWEFDRGMIHEKYDAVVDCLEEG